MGLVVGTNVNNTVTVTGFQSKTLACTVDAGHNGLLLVAFTVGYSMSDVEIKHLSTAIGLFSSGFGVTRIKMNAAFVFGLSPGSHDIVFEADNLGNSETLVYSATSAQWGNDSPNYRIETNYTGDDYINPSPARATGEAIFGVACDVGDVNITELSGNTIIHRGRRTSTYTYGYNVMYRNSATGPDSTNFGADMNQYFYPTIIGVILTDEGGGGKPGARTRHLWRGFSGIQRI